MDINNEGVDENSMEQVRWYPESLRVRANTNEEEGKENPAPAETPERTNNGCSTFTVDDAVEEIGFGAFQVVLTLVCGVIWFADAMELMLLTILSFLLKCQWRLSSAEEAALTTSMFAGALIGSVIWGVLGDTIGRKKAMIGMTFISFASGILSAQKLTHTDEKLPGYPWMLFCRFGVGFASSCIPQVSTYYIEFLPRRSRAICSVLISLWWSLGTIFSAGLAAAIMGRTTLGWHWFLGLSAAPMALAIVSVPFLPESARFYVVKGKHESARRVLERIAWFNCSGPLPEGKVVSQEAKYGFAAEKEREEKEEKANKVGGGARASLWLPSQSCGGSRARAEPDDDEYQPLLVNSRTRKKAGARDHTSIINSTGNDDSCYVSPSMESKTSFVGLRNFFVKLRLFFVRGQWKVTLLLVPIWIGTAWLYYGNILLSTTILTNNPHCDSGNGTSHYSNNSHNNNNNNNSGDVCPEGGGDVLDVGQYLKIMWMAAAELPAIFITILIIDLIGRRFTLAVNYLLLSGGLCLLYLCPNQAILTVILCFTRGVSDGVLRTMYVYTNEVYPTAIRGLGVGSFNSLSRVGASLTPYVAQVLFQVSDYAAIGVYAGFSLALVLVSVLLPVETKGRSLKDER